MATPTRRMTDVDKMVGGLLRSRRLALRMSQSALGDRLGVTFQQIQKYENGTNRISCGTIYRCSQVLEVPVAYFFQQLPKIGNGKKVADSNLEAVAFLASKEGSRLMRALSRLPKPVQRDMLNHINTVADTITLANTV
jgi:transcriptional regulator with XRE-family HTH domain